MMPREVHEKTEHLFREFNVRIINCCSCKEGLLSVLYRMGGCKYGVYLNPVSGWEKRFPNSIKLERRMIYLRLACYRSHEKFLDLQLLGRAAI